MPLLFTHDLIVMNQLGSDIVDYGSGARVCFVGTVRGINHEKIVRYLAYEAYLELAIKEFALIETRAKNKFGLRFINAVHRLGQVSVGESAVFIEVHAQHREPAFLGARFIMNELKKSVPIWKCEYYDDGSKSWDHGLCHCSFNDEIILEPVKKALLRHAIEAQKLAKKVLLVGAGGLGCPLAINLCALGIKKLGIVDGDIVSESNLARQFCFKRSEIGLKKSFLLAEFIRERFSRLDVVEYDLMMNANSVAMLEDYDLVVDATDSMATKVMLAYYARLMGLPFISSSVYQTEGEVSLLFPEIEGCFSCFKKNPTSENCGDSGVLTHACFMVAAHASAFALSALSSQERKNRFSLVLSQGIMDLKPVRDPSCMICSPLRIKSKELGV